jgi:D-aspartate ligase
LNRATQAEDVIRGRTGDEVVVMKNEVAIMKDDELSTHVLNKTAVRPAIVLSTHTMGLGVIRALGVIGIPVVAIYYDRNDMGYVSKYVKEKIYIAHPEKAESRFIEQLVKLSSRFSGGVLIPTSDEVLTTVSRHKDLLEKHYIVACTEWEITEKFIDKMHTYELAEKIGVPAPKMIVPRSMEDLERCDKAIRYPCLVKPRQSHRYYEIFKTKMVQVNNYDEMATAYRQAVSAGLEVILQEIIPGDDSQVVNYNSYFWNGKPLVEFTAQQLRKAPPEFGAPRVVMSKNIPEVIELGRSILRAMGFYGYSCTEFKRDSRDGNYKLMEINGRHNRSTLLAVRSGINFPSLQYMHLTRGELPSQSSYQQGIYWISLDRDIYYSLKYHRKERCSLLQYFRPYLRPHVFDVLTWKDPRPFLLRCYNLLKSAIHLNIFKGQRDPFNLDIGG